jgi:hypothetical protein
MKAEVVQVSKILILAAITGKVPQSFIRSISSQ